MTDQPLHHAHSSDAPDWEAIARYLDGEASAEESVRVAAWLDANPSDKELVEQLKTRAVVDGAADLDVDAALRRVHQRMGESPPTVTVERGGASRRRPVIITAVFAAIAAGLVAAIVINRDETPASRSTQPSVYTTSTGQRDSIRLADGSRVLLGPESRLTVPSDFGSNARSVELQGDAYFDVAHQESKPFTIRVANAIIEDVGTTFTVESDAGDGTTVSVMSGIVRLRPATAAADGGAVLSAGDRGVLTHTGEVRAEPRSVVPGDSAWTTGSLVFRNATLARVAGELRRWYGLKLGVADSSLWSRTVNTTFTAGQPVDEVLKVLSLMLGARVERATGSDSATIHPGRGSSRVK